MPRAEELRRFWLGLWQVARGDARGLSTFDISDEGLIRSLWAVVYCLPIFLLNAILLRASYLAAVSDPARGHFIFVFQSLVLQLASWIFVLSFTVLFGFALGYRPLLRPMVAMLNWGAVPVLYGIFGLLQPILYFTYGTSLVSWALNGTLWIVAIAIPLYLTWRILKTLVGGGAWRRGGFLFLVSAASLWLIRTLELSLGLNIPYL